MQDELAGKNVKNVEKEAIPSDVEMNDSGEQDQDDPSLTLYVLNALGYLLRWVNKKCAAYLL